MWVCVFVCVGVEVESAEDADTSVTFMAQVSSLSWEVQTGWNRSAGPAAAIFNLSDGEYVGARSALEMGHTGTKRLMYTLSSSKSIKLDFSPKKIFVRRKVTWGYCHSHFWVKIQLELYRASNGVPFHGEPLINLHLHNPVESDKVLS